MSDILSAASMLLAVLAILFGMWGPEISKAAGADNLTVPKNSRDKFNGFRSLYRARAIPLTAFAFIKTLVFLPTAVGIFLSSWKMYCEKGVAAGLSQYSPVTTSIVFVTILSGVLTGYLLGWTIQLKRWLRRNDPDRRQ